MHELTLPTFLYLVWVWRRNNGIFLIVRFCNTFVLYGADWHVQQFLIAKTTIFETESINYLVIKKLVG